MTSQIQIYHHLGLGDHIICNGLVRELCKRYEKVDCFVKTKYLSSVAFMYRDQPKITLVPVEDDWEVPFKAKRSVELIRIGFENLDASSSNFDESFYRQAGLEFQLRWDSFYVQRDYEHEYQLFRKMCPANDPYALVHDDPSRGLFVDLSFLERGLNIIRVSDCFVAGRLRPEFARFNLFHWIQVLENAQEIHCMDSSFKCLVESLPNMDHPKLVSHRYVRGKGAKAECTTRQDWITIDTASLGFMAQDSIRRVQSKIKKSLNRVRRSRGANKLTNSPPTAI